jgi:hypothetical protein
VISDEQASPEVKRIYDIRQRWSFVSNYFRALGHDAQLLQDQANLYTNAMFDLKGHLGSGHTGSSKIRP